MTTAAASTEIEAPQGPAEVPPDSVDGREVEAVMVTIVAAVVVEAVSEAIDYAVAAAEAVEGRRVADARVVRVAVAPRHERAVAGSAVVADNAHVVVIAAAIAAVAVHEVAEGEASWHCVAAPVGLRVTVGGQAGVGRVQAVKNTAVFVVVAVGANVVQA